MADHPLPWRVGRKVSRNIYDAADEPIAMLADEETARLIVDAVNGRDMVVACHEALAELQATRWNPMGPGGMKEWQESTVEGRSFAHVSKAMDLLKGGTRG